MPQTSITMASSGTSAAFDTKSLPATGLLAAKYLPVEPLVNGCTVHDQVAFLGMVVVFSVLYTLSVV